jgi:hypothetical protein
VCAFPYILAFTPDTMEIRLVVNGSLVNTMTMPNLQLVTSKVRRSRPEWGLFFISDININYEYSQDVLQALHIFVCLFLVSLHKS